MKSWGVECEKNLKSSKSSIFMVNWDDTMNDIVGAFRIFVTSAIVIFVALAVAKALYPTFPLSNTSSGVVSVVLGLFLVLIKYIKGKN